MDRAAEDRISARVIQGKTPVAEASRSFDLPPSEVEDWVYEAKLGMENALRARLLEIKAQYERQVKELQEAYAKPCWSYVPVTKPGEKSTS